MAAGWPTDEIRKAHEAAVAEHGVFGVPTFVTDERAVFVRLMTRSVAGDDLEVSRALIERVMAMAIDEPEINEFKHTTIGR